MRFGKKGDKFMQARLPGETYARSIHHIHFGKMLGAEYRRVLPRQVRKRKKIEVMEDIFIFDLLKNDEVVVGAIGIDLIKGEIVVINAKSTILATGGYMGCYNFTTANSTATGDGHAAAYRAGVPMTGMEFIQFIPTATLWPQIVRGDLFPYSLLNAVYGMFFNKMGERFMERYYPVEKDWATREAASRAIAQEVREGRGSPHGGAYLAFKHIPRNLMNTFLEANKQSSFLQNLEKVGFDIRQDALEVGPGAHYVQGGAWIDIKCKTNLERLYAIGEVGSGGKDGADRLAGNSLPFCMTMGIVAGKDAAESFSAGGLPEVDMDQVDMLSKKVYAYFDRTEGVSPAAIKTKVTQILGEHCIFDRTAEGLNSGIKGIEDIRENMLPKLYCASKKKTFNLKWVEALEAENMTLVAEMILKSAMMRQESRGLHERKDFPKADPNWLKHIIIKKVDDGMTLSTESVTFPYIQP
jgi:succinate dehydrogenase/fumarate reductase flavoprotein subunit